MGLDLRRDLLHGLHPYAAVQVVGDGGDDQDDDDRGEQPIHHELQERQLEHEEPDVLVELRVLDPEVDGVTEQDPAVPAAGDAGAGDQGEQGGHARAHEHGAGPDDLVVALDKFLLRAHGPESRGDAVGDGEVHPHEDEEQEGEQGRQPQLGPENAAPDACEVQLLEPQVVGVEAGDAAQGDDEDEHDRGGDQQPDAGSSGADAAPARHVGGAHRKPSLGGCAQRLASAARTRRHPHPTCAGGCSWPVG